MQKEKQYIRKLIKEELKKLEIKPNFSRSSGFSRNLIYLSISKSYAEAYANGETSSAHTNRFPIRNGVLFYVCLDNVSNHFGGDIWVSGYKSEIINDLNDYKENGLSEPLPRLTSDFLRGCGIDEKPTLKAVNFVLGYIKKDDLSIISPIDWSYIQEEYGGYSEICLKTISQNEIVKVEVFENEELIKTIKGKHKGDCETLFYHGSPLKFWKSSL